MAPLILGLTLALVLTAIRLIVGPRKDYEKFPHELGEAPAIPRSVADRLAGRESHPDAAERIAHARQIHFHDAEEAEARHA